MGKRGISLSDSNAASQGEAGQDVTKGDYRWISSSPHSLHEGHRIANPPIDAATPAATVLPQCGQSRLTSPLPAMVAASMRGISDAASAVSGRNLLMAMRVSASVAEHR
jgi:hypothetical protein